MNLKIKALTTAAMMAGAALCANAANAAVFVTTVDVTGVESFGEQGDPLNTLMDVLLASDAVVTGIGWDLDLTAFSPSWLSELTVGFLDSLVGLQLAPGAGDDLPGTAFYTSGGILDLASIDPTFPFMVGADGIMHLEFFEGFDDSSVSPDGVWAGTLTIQYEADDTPPPPVVPEPASWAMMISGLALVGAFMRRAQRTTKVSFA